MTQALLAALFAILTFLPTLLLESILQCIEGTKEASSAQIRHYVMLLVLTTVLASVAEARALWIGQRIGLQLRTILTTEVFQKTSRRPMSSRPSKLHLAQEKKDHSSQPAAVGTIMNLFMNDINVLVDSGSSMHQIWASVPVQIVMAIVLLYNALGISAFAGVALMAGMVPVNSHISKCFGSIQMQVMAASDARIESITEMVRSIRVIKLISWGPFFQKEVSDRRAVELALLRTRYMLWTTAATIWYSMPLLITFSSFFVYTAVQGRVLTPSLALASLSLFNLLKGPLNDFVGTLSRVKGALVSLHRVELVLGEEETDKYNVLGNPTARGQRGFEHATFS